MTNRNPGKSKMTDGLLCPQCTNLSLIYHNEFYEKEMDNAKDKKADKKRKNKKALK
ncbi:MAG: hypothetical protein N4A76_09310 [Firmicutes bacterium]|jgi:hypothetical protein|nr:hypothetical protein [Bacillota bacterium]